MAIIETDESQITKHSCMVVIVQIYELLNKHQWKNYLQIIWYYVLFHSPIYKYGKNCAKKNRRFLSTGIKKFKKLILLEKKILLNTTLNTCKTESIIPRIKTYSLSIILKDYMIFTMIYSFSLKEWKLIMLKNV